MCYTFEKLPFKPPCSLTQTSFLLCFDIENFLRVTRSNLARGAWPPWDVTRFLPPSPSTHQTSTTGGERSSAPLRAKALHEEDVLQNDLVAFADHPGSWKVVAPVNGSKVDICRSEGFDMRIVTVPLRSITVPHRPTSPGYSY